MKYIKTYKLFENSNPDIKSELKKYNIENYTINSDESIDVKGNVYISYNKSNKIPFKFNEITGYFTCARSQLTSLEGCPTEVGSYFDCNSNELTSLEYCPLEIGGDLFCSWNRLIMLDCSSYVKGNIYCFGMFEQEPEFFGDCEGKIIWKR